MRSIKLAGFYLLVAIIILGYFFYKNGTRTDTAAPPPATQSEPATPAPATPANPPAQN